MASENWFVLPAMAVAATVMFVMEKAMLHAQHVRELVKNTVQCAKVKARQLLSVRSFMMHHAKDSCPFHLIFQECKLLLQSFQTGTESAF